MTARSIVPMLALAVVLAGCLALVPFAADDTSGATDADAVYDSILKRIGKDGTAGASLELNEEEAMDLIRTVVLALPDDAVGSIEFLEYVRTADSPTFGGFMASINDASRDIDIDAAGGLYILAASKSVDGGFEYDIKVRGEIDAEGVGILEARDPKNPSTDLTDRIGVKGTIDARILLKTDGDLVPQQVTVNSNIGISLTGEQNYSLDHVRTDDGFEAVYSHTAATSTKESLGIESHIHASVDGLTKDDIKGILDPSRENIKDIVLSYSTILRNGDLASIRGSEIAALIDLNSLVGNVSGDVGFDDIRDQEIPSNSEELYFLMQRILAESGLYVSEQDYRTVIAALKDVKTSLRSGNLEYFYDTANGKYVSSAGLAEEIEEKVKGCPGADVVRVTEGECGLEFTKGYRDRYVEVTDFKGDSKIPDSILGYNVLKAEQEDEPEVDIWFGNGDHTSVYPDYYNMSTYTALVWGEMPTGAFNAVVGDGSDVDLNSLVAVKALKSKSMIAWYLQIAVEDTYRLIGQSVKISCGDQTWVLDFESPYSGDLCVVDGLVYILYDSDACVIGATSEAGKTIVIPSKLQYDGKEYEVYRAEMKGLTLDSLSVTVGTSVRLPDCSVGEIVFKEGDSHYFIDVSFVDDMSTLGKLTFEAKQFTTFGKVTKEGWAGPGGIINHEGIDYILQYRSGELAVNAEIRASSGDIFVPSSIPVDGQDVPVYSISIWNSSISKLDAGTISGLNLNDAVIEELTLENSAWISTYDGSKVRAIVFANSDTIYVQCSNIAKISGLESISVRGPVQWMGDIESIKDLLSGTYEIHGIRYLKDDTSKMLTFMEVYDADITIHGKIVIDGVVYTVNPFDLREVRTIGKVVVESFPVGGVDLSYSSVTELVFDNEKSINIAVSSVSYCDKLENVLFNGPVGTIGSNAFESSTEIGSLKFFDTINEIGYYAFPAIGGISELVFEKDVGTVRGNAFGGMNDLTLVHFKGSVGVIEFDAFRECPSLEYIKIDGSVWELNGSSECNAFTNLYIGGDVGTIPFDAFQNGPYSTDGEVNKKEFEIRLGEKSTISSIEGFAFKNMYLSQETIDSLLDRSVYVSVTAFYNVITGYDDEGGIPYRGISANDNDFGKATESGITYYCSLYIEDRNVSIDITGMSIVTDDEQNQITIPAELALGDKKYPVASIMDYKAMESHIRIDKLTIGSNVKHIGDSLSGALPNLKEIAVSDNKMFGVEAIGTDADSLQMLYRNPGDGSKEFICFVGSTKADIFVVPSGFEEFDLSWFRGSEIKSLVIGDGIRTVYLGSDSIEGIETISFGKDVEEIEGVPSNSIQKFIVADGNCHFLVYGDALYEIDADSKTARLIAYPPAKTGDVDIPGTVGEYEVIEIDYSAFWYSGLSKVTLPDSIVSMNLSSFESSEIAEVVVSDSVSQVYGQYYPFDRSGNYSIKLKNIHSKNGQTLFTEDGAIYLKRSDGTLKLVDYLGDKDILMVKEGTTDINLSYLGAKKPTKIVLPQDVVWAYMEYDFHGSDDSSDSRIIHILMPKEAYQNSNFDGVHFLIRTYSTSEDYDISLVADDSGLNVSMKAESYAKISDVTMGTYDVSTGAIPWDTLFPDPTSGMSKTYVYPDSIEVSYTVDEYTVTFVTDSVDTISPQKVKHGDIIGALRSPMKANMRFMGWYTDSEYTELYDIQEPVTSDLTLYARWTSLDSQVTVYTCEGIEYALLGEFGFYNGQEWWMPYGTYELTWRLDYGYTGNPIIKVNGRYTGTTITISQDKVDISITGFEKEWYSVDFVNNVSRGTADTATRTVQFEGGVSLPDVTATDGYEFVGWTDGLAIVGDGYRIVKDTVLTAAYVRTESNDYYQEEYTITLDVPSNGTLAAAHVLKGGKGDVIALPKVVPASGYRFDGWSVGGTTVTGGYMVLGDATLTASISRIADVPTTPVLPDEPKEDVKENEDGSTTVTVKNEDGTTTSTTTKTELDGSTTVKEEVLDKEGNKTGTSTTVTNPDGSSVKKEEVLDKEGNATSTTTTTTEKDGSSTKTEESKTENGSSVKEEKFDKDGNSQGSTTKVVETVTTDSGSTLETETVTTADGSGRTMDEVTSVKAESEDGKIRTEAVVEKRNDGTFESSATTTVKAESIDGRVDVAHEDVEAALKQMDEVVAATGDVEKKVIEIGTSVKSDETEVSISSESLKTISDAGAEVRIAGDVGTVTMGSDVSKNLADRSAEGNGPVSVSVGKADRTAMSSVQQDVVGDSVVLQLRASVGDESVHELGGTVTVTVPYVLSPGENPDLIRVYYVDDDGGLHLKLSRYDPSTGTVSFETDHFSFYMIGQAVEDVSDDGEKNRTAVIVAGLAVIVVAAVAAGIFLNGRKH